jgi:anti-sigma factor RsiW
MKTSWNKAQAIEKFLSGTLPAADALLFRARLLTDPELRRLVALQQKTYALVRLYGRQQMKARLEALHRQLMGDPTKKTFQQQVLQYFTKS